MPGTFTRIRKVEASAGALLVFGRVEGQRRWVSVTASDVDGGELRVWLSVDWCRLWGEQARAFLADPERHGTAIGGPDGQWWGSISEWSALTRDDRWPHEPGGEVAWPHRTGGGGGPWMAGVGCALKAPRDPKWGGVEGLVYVHGEGPIWQAVDRVTCQLTTAGVEALIGALADVTEGAP